MAMMDTNRSKTTTTIRRVGRGKEPPAWKSWSTRNPILRVLYGVLIVGGIVILLGPRLRDVELPKPGMIAQRNWDAAVDFTFERENPDVEEQRRAAEDQVLPIYRYLPERRDSAVDQLNSAFELARPVVREHEQATETIKAQLVTDLEMLEERKATLVAEQIEAERQREIYEQEKREAEAERKRIEAERKRLEAEQKRQGRRGAPPEPAPEVALPEVPEPVAPEPRDFVGELVAVDKEIEEARASSERLLKEEKRAFEAKLGELHLRFQQILNLGPTFDADDFSVLVRNGFSNEVARVLKQIVKGVMENRIVRTRYQLEDRLRKGLRDPIQQTIFTMEDLDLFVELDDARSMAVERARNFFAEQAMAEREPGSQVFTPRLQNVVFEIAASMVDENYVYDPRATQAEVERARRSVLPVSKSTYQKGQKIVARGDRVTDEDVAVLKTMLDAQRQTNRLVVLAGVLVFTVVAFTFLWLFSHRDMRKMLRGDRDVALFGLLVLLQVAVVKLFAQVMEGVVTVWDDIPMLAFFLAIPFAMGSMVARLFLNVEAAVLYSIVASLFTGLLFQDVVVRDFETVFPQLIVIYTLVTSLVGTYAMHDIRQRTSLLRAGFFVGIVNAVVIFALTLIVGGRVDSGLVSMMTAGLIAGVLNYLLVLALTPALEYTFGYTTDIKLLELANITQPALKELSMKAPGTYHHSVMVGNLAEAAAESIGANPLMTRVGAYYHDLGKMRNPRYFAENQAGDNPHDKLKPQMSALIIKSHVKDGIEIARGHRLPTDIVDFIPQHHGTALIGFFYARAKEQATLEEVDEADYRYPGPKPQRRETALVMLADGVEAAARSLPEPTPARIKGLVKKIVNGKFIDGQLDECDLTLKDLHEIGRSFTRILVSMYHARPEYPKIPGEDERQRARRGLPGQLPTAVGAPDDAGRKKPRKTKEDADAGRAEQSAAEASGGREAVAAKGARDTGPDRAC